MLNVGFWIVSLAKSVIRHGQVYVAGLVNQRLLLQNEYLAAESCILRS
jgi:hypothetical protein